MAHDRRHSNRIAAGWQGRYTLDDRPEDHYRCRVIDVSLGGAGLVLFGPAPLEKVGIRVELRAALPTAVQLLPARARYMGRTTRSGVRIGVEWLDLTRAQTTMLKAIMKETYLRAS